MKSRDLLFHLDQHRKIPALAQAQIRKALDDGSVDQAAAVLSADPPALVHLTALASHRGVVQLAAAIAEVCRGLGVPLVIDAAVNRPHRLCGGCRCDLLVLAQVDGRPARRRCPRDPARVGAAAATAAAAAGLGSAVDRVAAAGERRGQCLRAPVLRVSPHVDSATEDLEALAEALAEATELSS